MRITRRQVEHIAHLARLRFTEEEIEDFTRQLDDILSSFDKLREVDTISVQATSHAIMVKNVFREDVVRPSVPREQGLRNAPEEEEDCFRVPKIIE